jgi:hypothetical protein
MFHRSFEQYPPYAKQQLPKQQHTCILQLWFHKSKKRRLALLPFAGCKWQSQSAQKSL